MTYLEYSHPYTAPKVLKDEQYRLASDIHSFGILMSAVSTSQQYNMQPKVFFSDIKNRNWLIDIYYYIKNIRATLYDDVKIIRVACMYIIYYFMH